MPNMMSLSLLVQTLYPGMLLLLFFFFFAIDRTTKTLTAPNFIQEARMELSLLRSFIVNAGVVLGSKISLCARIQHLSRQRLETNLQMGQPRTSGFV